MARTLVKRGLVELNADVDGVVLMLRGGFGNQLFQYAAAKRLLAGSPTGRLRIYSHGNEWGGEHPDLTSVLGTAIRFPKRLDRTTIPHLAVHESWKDTVSSAIASRVGQLTSTQVVIQDDPFERLGVPPAPRYVLDGYFQHPDWWGSTWAAVADELLSAEPEGLDGMRERRRIAVKVRRSDYVSHGWALPDRYFEDAFDTLGIRDSEVTVLCEDEAYLPEFAHLIARFGCTIAAPTVVTGNRNFDDFWNLAAASTIVIANSSYCWWAAAAAQRAEASTRVVYPTPWFVNSWSDKSLPDMGLPGWIALPSGLG